MENVLDLLLSIDGAYWIVFGILGPVVLIGLGVVAYFQGDMLIRTSANVPNNNEEAATVFTDQLLARTRKQIIIHDDGNDSPGSVYNNPDVIAAFRERIRERNISVLCLFNDRDQIELLKVRDAYPDNVKVWYTSDRPPNDPHYKIVDDGRMVHVSAHEHKAEERQFTLHDGRRSWGSARRRVSQLYREHFDRSTENRSPERPATAAA